MRYRGSNRAHSNCAGYRHVDTAAIYNTRWRGGGRSHVGRRARADFPHHQALDDEQGFDQTLRAMEASLKRLGTDYVDLYLIHWPAPKRDRYATAGRLSFG